MREPVREAGAEVEGEADEAIAAAIPILGEINIDAVPRYYNLSEMP